MNNLSWMIYLADVAGDINFVASMVIGAGTVSLVLGGLFAFISAGFDEMPGWAKPAGMNIMIACAIAAFIGTVVPDKSTIYAIAASEMGENIINTPTASKAVKALDAWLDSQIEQKGNGHD